MLEVLDRYDMWTGIGKLNTGADMPMPLKPEFENEPCISRPYPLSRYKQQLLDPLLDQLEKDGIIEDAEASNFSSPVLLVVQKGKPRFVVDYRKINARSVPDSYPLPRQEQILNSVHQARYITLFDIRKAFFQMPIGLSDRHKTTFVLPHRGAKRLTRALMGYLNSPGFCQRQLDKLIDEYKWDFVVCYVDDVVVYSNNWQDHVNHVNWVLKQIHGAGLTLDPTKAFIGFESVNLLGHLVSRFGLSTQREKIASMTSMPAPTNVEQLDHCLGFFGYYRAFVESYAQIAAPLISLLKGVDRKDTRHHNKPIEFSADCREAFDLLKARLATTCERAHSEWVPGCSYILYVDACKLGYGGALHIQHPASGKSKPKEMPVIFISRNLKNNERAYWPTELELGGLVWCLTKLEHILEGQKLTIYTDHVALSWLFSVSATKTHFNQRLLLWAISLQKWRPTTKIVHRAGRAHVNADVLSRYPIASEFPSDLRRECDTTTCPDPHRRSSRVNAISIVEVSDSFKDKLRSSYKTDRHFRAVVEKLESSPENQFHAYRFDPNTQLLYFRDISMTEKPWRLAIPSALVPQMFELAHDKLGHMGFEKSYDRLNGLYIPQMARKLRSYIGACHTCLEVKSKRSTDGLLVPIETPGSCFDRIAMDFVSGFPASPDGYDSILTITDKFTKVLTIIATKTTDDAEKTAERFFHGFYLRYGLPGSIISDRDTRFVSLFWTSLAKRVGTDLLLSTAYHAQTDGESERSNQTVENVLRSVIGYGLDDEWEKKMGEIEFLINTSKHAATGSAPYEVLYGFRPRSLTDLVAGTADKSFTREEWIANRRILRQEVSDAIADAATTMARHYDRSHRDVELNVGDMVMVRARQGLTIPGVGSGKLSRRFFGPFKILARIGATAYKVKLPHEYKMHNVINVQHLKGCPRDEFNRLPPPPPPPVVVDDTWADYEVDSILDKRKRRGQTQYLVKFKGYNNADALWYDESDSESFSELRDEYNARVEQGVVRRSSRRKRS